MTPDERLHAFKSSLAGMTLAEILCTADEPKTVALYLDAHESVNALQVFSPHDRSLIYCCLLAKFMQSVNFCDEQTEEPLPIEEHIQVTMVMVRALYDGLLAGTPQLVACPARKM